MYSSNNEAGCALTFLVVLNLVEIVLGIGSLAQGNITAALFWAVMFFFTRNYIINTVRG